MRPRTRAFTLPELAVVMVISSLLLIAAYYGLTLIQQYYTRFRTQQVQSLQYRTLNSVLQQDFEKSKYILRQDNRTVTCHWVEGSTSYQFTSDAVVRKQAGLQEKFPGTAQDLQCYFLTQEVFVAGKPISTLSFTLKVEDQLLRYRAQRTYAADELMQLTPTVWPD
ncbi:PulJ/GspJ family protein [Tunicatimonas pelagia]|uniref:PulJ/GspJ family protein n=1 Tax=Tunicatimonas pelagia TaxID=931531 RepID=UPI0026654DF6|nr:prepilin-type N-terminal cleavage/methylation domain-containing protein [Tunicatimonas pelagia]WKN45350.1 prepilin-type N-terminal cleavage/methylation domain-containing protein [Tunicatimonas pelagia]